MCNKCNLFLLIGHRGKNGLIKNYLTAMVPDLQSSSRKTRSQKYDLCKFVLLFRHHSKDSVVSNF